MQHHNKDFLFKHANMPLNYPWTNLLDTLETKLNHLLKSLQTPLKNPWKHPHKTVWNNIETLLLYIIIGPSHCKIKLPLKVPWNPLETPLKTILKQHRNFGIICHYLSKSLQNNGFPNFLVTYLLTDWLTRAISRGAFAPKNPISLPHSAPSWILS